MEYQVRAEYDGSPEEREAQRLELERRDEERERREAARRQAPPLKWSRPAPCGCSGAFCLCFRSRP